MMGNIINWIVIGINIIIIFFFMYIHKKEKEMIESKDDMVIIADRITTLLQNRSIEKQIEILMVALKFILLKRVADDEMYDTIKEIIQELSSLIDEPMGA